MASFDDLSTEKFRLKMRPAAIRIYERLFPGCKIQDLREQGVKVHVLDKEFGIDTMATLASGQWLTIQEKYRKREFYDKYRVDKRCPDFTQEYKNGVGTKHESDGEWFKLGAQLYFYGWANEQQTDFHDWMILDIALYKTTVEEAGGLLKIGKLMQNNAHGRASFVAIPTMRLGAAVYATRRTLFLPAECERLHAIRGR